MKARKGNAYIMVMVASMALLLLVSTALLITAGSRQMTARYPDFFGLYDLAVAGNERAVFLLNEGELPVEALPYSIPWNLSMEINTPGAANVLDVYEAVTTILKSTVPDFEYMVKTAIYKVVDGVPGHKITVEAQIALDGYRYEMVQLRRRID